MCNIWERAASIVRLRHAPGNRFAKRDFTKFTTSALPIHTFFTAPAQTESVSADRPVRRMPETRQTIWAKRPIYGQGECHVYFTTAELAAPSVAIGLAVLLIFGIGSAIHSAGWSQGYTMGLLTGNAGGDSLTPISSIAGGTASTPLASLGPSSASSPCSWWWGSSQVPGVRAWAHVRRASRPLASPSPRAAQVSRPRVNSPARTTRLPSRPPGHSPPSGRTSDLSF